MIPGNSSLLPLNNHLIHLPYLGVQQATLWISLPLPFAHCYVHLFQPFPRISHLHLGAVQQGPQSFKWLHWLYWGKWRWALVHILLLFRAGASTSCLPSHSTTFLKGYLHVCSLLPTLPAALVPMLHWDPLAKVSGDLQLSKPKVTSPASSFSVSHQCSS